MTTKQSEPEPDLAIVRGSPGDYFEHHPAGVDVALIVEVAYSSLDTDRDKRLIYARAGIPVYWIVNLEDRCLEVCTDVYGRGRNRDYGTRRQLGVQETVQQVIAGHSCGVIAVSDMIRV